MNVKFLVPLSNDAVTSAKLADVFKDSVVAFILFTDVNKLAVAEFTFVIDMFTLALLVSNELTLWLFDDV